MIRTSFKRVLLVAPDVFPDQLIADYKNVKHITAVGSVFPSLFDLNPDLVIFDYDYIGKDAEKMLRRIKLNKFYSKLKIYCFKNKSNEKTDSLLKAIGVDHFIYMDELLAKQKARKTVITVNSLIDTSILKWVSGVAN